MQDFDFEIQSAQERRRMAQALRNQGFQMPEAQMVGGRYIAPGIDQVLVQALKQYGATKEEKAAENQIRALNQQRAEKMQSALDEFLIKSQGRPAEVLPPDVAGPARPAEAPNLMGAYEALMQAPDPSLRQMGMQGITRIPELQAQREEKQAQRDFQRQQAELQNQQFIERLQMQHQMRLEAMREQNASREQMAQAQREFQEQMANIRSSIGTSSQPYFQPVQTAQGVMAFNARTGRVEPVVGSSGQPIIGAQYDPALQGSLAGSKTGATTEAKLRTEARLDAPKAIAQGEETIRLVDDLLKAPGMKQAVGASRMLGIQKIPGTPAKDFDVRLDQLKGQQFLQAFESLKGGGAITEIEGKKATDAIARMDAAGSEAEFTKAAREFQSVIRQGVARAKNAQGVQTIQPAQTTPPNELFNAADAILNKGKK